MEMRNRNDVMVTIVVSYEESYQLLCRTLRSIDEQVGVSFQTIIVTRKSIEEQSDYRIVTCTSIAQGYNQLLQEELTPYVLFMQEGDHFGGRKDLYSQYRLLEGKTKQHLYVDDSSQSSLRNKRLYTLKSECRDVSFSDVVIPKLYCDSPLLTKVEEQRFSREFVQGVYTIDIDKNYFALQTSLYGCLIRSRAFSEYQFPEKVCFEYMNDCALRLLLQKRCYLVDDRASYYYHQPRENQVLFHIPAHYPQWYQESLDHYVLPLIEWSVEKEGEVSPYLQNYLTFYILCRLLTNLDNRNKKQITEQNKTQYFSTLKEVMRVIDDFYLLNQDRLIYQTKNPEILCMLLHLKYGDKIDQYQYIDSVDDEGNPDIEMRYNDCLISRLSTHRFSINIMDYRRGELCLDGSLISIFRYCDLQFFASFEGQDILVKDTNMYSLTKYFGIPSYRRLTYHLQFLLDSNKEIQRLSFYAFLNGKKYPMKIAFANHWAKLSKTPRYSYWRFHQYFCHHANNGIVIKKATRPKVLKREIQFQLNLLLKPSKQRWKALGFRWLYWVTHPYFKRKKIWLMLDKLYKGGDSCEYLYRYCVNKEDGITKYYVINSDTVDYENLKKDGLHPLKNKTLWHKLVFVNADLVLITNSHLFPFNGYTKNTSKYIRGLCNFSSMCLQHGLTVQKCAVAQRRIIDNTTGYFLASRFEYDNLMHHAYGYAGFDYLHLTGIGRYDGLISDDKKQILISPTWRMYNALPVLTSEGEQRGYNPDFKHTRYFQIYNQLINNEKLLSYARKYGYKIKYLLHPIVSSQSKDFTSNSEVEIIPSVGNLSYEQILTQSSLMVTDYSGVQFDFAYMRKPIVYFHPEELPPHYDDGIFFYDTMGFGEICTKTDQLVDLLCDYIKNGCQMKQVYKKRADDFFVYDDHNNCERIYTQIMKDQIQIDKDKLRKDNRSRKGS